MKSGQETTSLSKADNKRQAFINTDTRRFKIQTGDMEPTPTPPHPKVRNYSRFLETLQVPTSCSEREEDALHSRPQRREWTRCSLAPSMRSEALCEQITSGDISGCFGLRCVLVRKVPNFAEKPVLKIIL